MNRRITNTEKTSPLAILAEVMLEGSADGVIERMERQGGEEMVVAETLPVDGSDRPDVLALGIQFGDVGRDDPIFRAATLPAGWKRDSAGHPNGYWTYIVDERGEERAAIFYKAAFYDRKAHISAVRQCSCGHSQNSHPYVEDRYPDPYPCAKCSCDGTPLA